MTDLRQRGAGPGDGLHLSGAAAVVRWLTGFAGFEGGFLMRTLLPWLLVRPGRWLPALRLLRSLAAAEARRREMEHEHGIELPTTLVISPTSTCNLRCPTCFLLDTLDLPARELDPATLRRVLGECRELGISQVVIAGGEPLLLPGVDDLVAEHSDLYFTVFTNGRPLTRRRAERYAEAANVTFVVNAGSGSRGLAGALEPGVERALALLEESGALFGVAATVSSENLELFASLETLERIRRLGARFALFFAYLPDLLAPDRRSALLVPPRVRRAFVECVRAWGVSRRFFVVFAPEDEVRLTGGCGAAGRRVIHLAADGALEPCPFVPCSPFHVSRHRLLDALRSEYFRTLRERSRAWERGAAGCAYRAHASEFDEISRRHGVVPDGRALQGTA